MDLKVLPDEDLAALCSSATDADAWAELVSRFQKPVALIALRVTRSWGESSTSVVDDLVQETFLKLCANQRKLLREFVASRPGALGAYVRVIAANVAHDYFRQRKSLKRGGNAIQQADPEDSLDNATAHQSTPELIERGIQISQVFSALDAIPLEELGNVERAVFWLYYKQGLSAKAISSIPCVRLGIKGVESLLYRMVQRIKRDLRTGAAGLNKGLRASSTFDICEGDNDSPSNT